ncbi:MAG TPA: hypothetical protein VHA11_13495 [Bryobacteraceae bacterium]|nr:hypothetical protein [Bryobacteraceae bacterium]
MRSKLLGVGLLTTFCAVVLSAQSGGIPPEWELQKRLTALADHVQRIKPVLDQLKPQDWVSQGAPAAYQNQVQRTRSEIDYLIGTTKELTARPEKLTLALETYLRMQSIEAMLRSVAGGIRKYHNPAVADLLESLIANTTTDRDLLREYLVELAADREQQFALVDREAQRCRASLVRQPAAVVHKSGPKEERR